jgi:hypothetical protein
MCPRRYVKLKNEHMDGDLWRRLIDEIAETYPEAIILPFWRGESLLHPDFPEFIDYALNKSLRVHISTNGHLVEGEHAGILARCEFVTFSIHTGLGLDLARKFLLLKKDGKPTVQVSFVEEEKTAKFLDQILQSPDLDGFDSVRLYEEHSKNGVLGKSGDIGKLPRNFCPKLSDTLVIAHDGSISRCNHIWNTEKEIDLNKVSIREAWQTACLRQIRTEYPDSVCGPCDQWTGHTRGESWRVREGRIEHLVF